MPDPTAAQHPPLPIWMLCAHPTATALIIIGEAMPGMSDAEQAHLTELIPHLDPIASNLTDARALDAGGPSAVAAWNDGDHHWPLSWESAETLARLCRESARASAESAVRPHLAAALTAATNNKAAS